MTSFTVLSLNFMLYNNGFKIVGHYEILYLYTKWFITELYLIKEFCLLYSALGPLHETVIDAFSCKSVKKKKRVKWTEKEERLFFQVKVIIFI